MPTLLICPNCDTRYETAAVIPPEGRKVRCSKCSTVWTATRETSPEIEPGGGEASARPAPAASPNPAPRAPAAGGSMAAAGMEPARKGPMPALPPARSPNGVYARPDDDLEFRDAAEDGFAQRQDDQSAYAEFGNGRVDSGAGFDMPAEPEKRAGRGGGPDRSDAPGMDRFDPYTDTSFDIDEDRPSRPEPQRFERRDVALAQQHDAPPPVNLPREPRRRGSSPVIGWLLLLLMLASLAALVVLSPTTVVRFLPGAAPIYQAFGVNVNSRGLDFRNVTYNVVYEGGGGQLEISGDIVNLTGQPIDTPTVIFSLRDANGTEVQQFHADVLQAPIAGNATEPFAARLPMPDGTVKSFEVGFAGAP